MPKLTLSLAELMAVEASLGLECITNEAVPATGLVEDGPQFRNLCLKVGSALCESARTKSDVELVFNADELWLLRENIDVYATSGDDQSFGLTLKCKVYAALLTVSDTPQEPASEPFPDEADPAFDASTFARWMEGDNADSHGTNAD